MTWALLGPGETSDISDKGDLFLGLEQCEVWSRGWQDICPMDRESRDDRNSPGRGDNLCCELSTVTLGQPGPFYASLGLSLFICVGKSELSL